MVDIKRKPRENVSMMLRRFTQRVRQSGILIDAKKARFKQSKKSRIERRKGAIEREKRRKEKNRLKKLGKYEPKRKNR